MVTKAGGACLFSFLAFGSAKAADNSRLEVEIGFQMLEDILKKVEFLDVKAVRNAEPIFSSLVAKFNSTVATFKTLPDPDYKALLPLAMRVEAKLRLLASMIDAIKPPDIYNGPVYTPLDRSAYPSNP